MNRKLVVVAGPDEGKVIPIGNDTVLLGRSRATDSKLIDPHVGRIHAQLVPEGDQLVLVDFESAGGTFVNGKPIEKQTLKPGDLIRIGKTHMQFLQDFASPAPAQASVPLAKPVGAWAEELVGQTFSTFEIGSILARGQQGFVFHGRDNKRDIPVAIKVLNPEFSQDEKKVAHFVEAMKTVMPLKHANLLKIYGAGKAGKHCWLAVEYIAGESLAAVIGRISAPGKLDWKPILRVAECLAKALEYAHERQLYHRNVTPQNVLVGKHAQDTKLADLMLADAIVEDPTKPISAAGTPSEALAYQSPERTDGPNASIDARTDLYSLGAMLHAMFTGKPPFQGETVDEVVTQIRLDAPVRLRSLNISIPEPFELLLRRLLAKRPQDRPASAQELVKELHRIAVV